jgi:hypothetical protein
VCGFTRLSILQSLAFRAFKRGDARSTSVIVRVQVRDNRPNYSLRFRCKACQEDFTVTSGKLFAFHKLPLKGAAQFDVV